MTTLTPLKYFFCAIMLLATALAFAQPDKGKKKKEKDDMPQWYGEKNQKTHGYPGPNWKGPKLKVKIKKATELDGHDGAIDITIIGGAPPFLYSWNTGARHEDLKDIPAGEYSVTVTDINGKQAGMDLVVETKNYKYPEFPPNHYWTFENFDSERGKRLDPYKDIIKGRLMEVSTGDTLLKEGQAGHYAYSMRKGKLHTTINPAKEQLSIEMIVKLDRGFKKAQLIGGTTKTPLLVNITPEAITITWQYVGIDKKPVKEKQIIRLTGVERESFSWYFDEQWHHLAFVIDLKEGEAALWVDGQLPDSYLKNLENTGTFAGGSTPISFNTTGARFGGLDEIAVYYQAIPATLIYQHYRNAGIYGQRYVAKNTTQEHHMPEPKEIIANIDGVEYPGGYPELNNIKTPLEQLQSFPAPRYRNGHKLYRNFPWFNYEYLSGRGVKASWPKNYEHMVDLGVQAQQELVQHWNYYLRIEGHAREASQADFAVKKTHLSASVKLANEHPEWPLAKMTMWTGVQPRHLDPSYSKTAFVRRFDLSNNHYVQDAKGKVVEKKGKRFWSPEAPLDKVKLDGETQKLYLSNLYQHLQRPINIINENGEVRPVLMGNNPKLLKADANISAAQQASGLSWSDYQSTKKMEQRNAYRNAFMKGMPQLKNTLFTYYSIDGKGGHRRASYAIARKTLSKIRGQYYATPDFYPETPNNWGIQQKGPKHGLGWITGGRYKELAQGDQWFSPFVAAGWSANPQKNMRPAQWLGLLKVLGMFGAEFYYTGYFSNVNKTEGVQDPKHWVWQTVMPSYAQATTSHYENIFRNGKLLDNSKGQPAFILNSGDPRHVVSGRFLEHPDGATAYAFTGTIQPYSNIKGNAPLKSTAKVYHHRIGKEVWFNIRRQGSTYVLVLDTNAANAPIFYQLDEWHETAHPEHWSKDIVIQAEVADNPLSFDEIYTENSKGEPFNAEDSLLNFTRHTTYVSHPNNTPNMPGGPEGNYDMPYVIPTFEYSFTPGGEAANNTYQLWVRARSESTGNIKIGLKNENGTVLYTDNIACINSKRWQWYQFGECSAQPITFKQLAPTQHQLLLLASNVGVDIDQMVLKHPDGEFTPDPSEVVSTPCKQTLDELSPALHFTYGCAGTEVKFNSWLPSKFEACPHGTIQYEWNINGATTSNEANTSYTFQTPGTYPVALTVTHPHYPEPVTVTREITIYELPQIVMKRNPLVAEGGKAQAKGIQNMGGKPPYQYQWWPSAGVSHPTAKNPEFYPESTMEYTLTVKDSRGCATQKSLKVIVNQ